MASILPLAKTQFLDGNGDPLAYGTVEFFVPNTDTQKDTWQDVDATILNDNPVVLDADGRAIIFGTGLYRQLVKDSDGNMIWDQTTGEASATSGAVDQFWAGTSTGSANSLILTIADGPTAYGSGGLSIDFLAGYTNTGAVIANVNGIGNVAVENNGVALVGGEIQVGRMYRLTYDGSVLNLTAMSPDMAKRIDVASAASIDLTNVRAGYIMITGVIQIDAIVMLDSQEVDVVFEQALILSNNANLILPGGAALLTAAGDTMILRGEAASVTRCIMYSRAATLSTETYGLYGARGVVGNNNAVTPDTKFDWYADAIALKNVGNGLVVRYNPGTITNNIIAASPAVNARDQAGAFSASQWIHFYWIWNGVTLGTIASLTAPPTGPTMPTGYTHWAYAGAIRLNSSTKLEASRVRGGRVTWDTRATVVDNVSSGSETTVDISDQIPPNALTALLFTRVKAPVANVSGTLSVRLSASADFAVMDFSSTDTSNNNNSSWMEIPNVGQEFLYQLAGGGGVKAFIYTQGYTVSNGS